MNVSPLTLCCNTLLTKKECNKVIITLTLRRSCRRRHVYATIQLVKNPTSDPTDSNEFFLLSLCTTSQEAATATAARVRVLWYFGVPRLVCLGYSLSIASKKRPASIMEEGVQSVRCVKCGSALKAPVTSRTQSFSCTQTKAVYLLRYDIATFESGVCR